MSLTREQLESKTPEELLERFHALCKGVLKLMDSLKKKGVGDVARPAFAEFSAEVTRRVN